MNVIRHQAICPDLQPIQPGILAEECEVNFPILVGEEHRLAPVSTTGDMVRVIRNDHPSKSSHTLHRPLQAVESMHNLSLNSFFSLIESAKRHGLNVFEYLSDVIRRLPSWPRKRLGELLPDRWTPEVPAAVAA